MASGHMVRVENRWKWGKRGVLGGNRVQSRNEVGEGKVQEVRWLRREVVKLER